MASLIDVAILTQKKAELEAEVPRLRSQLDQLRSQLDFHIGAVSFLDQLLADTTIPRVEMAEAKAKPKPPPKEPPNG